MFAVNPGVLAAGVGGAKTYAEFVAHIMSRATAARPWGSTPWFPNTSAGERYTIAASATGEMRGSPWGPSSPDGYVQQSWSGGNSSTCRVVQHCLPSLTEFNNQASNNYYVFFSYGALPIVNTRRSGVNRNGFMSDETDSGTWRAGLITELIYWDGERAQRMWPSLGLGPEPYDW